MSQIEIAKAIATIAHRGQVDKSGEPYIEHPRRVAEAVRRRVDEEYIGTNTEREDFVAAAWLHDVVEDSDISTPDLADAGVHSAVISAVQELTKKQGQSNAQYYESLKGDLIARWVKIADVQDNLDPVRLSKLDDETIVRLVKKYAKAMEALS